MKFDKKKKLIQLIHVAKSKLQLDDDTYRAVLEGCTGKTSTKQMTAAQLQAVLNRFKELGFNIQHSHKTKATHIADDAQSRMIRHLWLTLYNAGEIRNPSEFALHKFVERHTGVSAVQWLSTDNASKIIEHLKQWCQRKGIELNKPIQ